MLERDKFTIRDCVLENGKHLRCEFPENCCHCLFFKYKGKGKDYLLAAFHSFACFERRELLDL